MRAELALSILCAVIVAGGLGGLIWYLISPFTRDDGREPRAHEPWDDGRWS